MNQATSVDSTAVSSLPTAATTTATVLSSHPFSVREVYKAGWLKRSGNTDRSGPFGRKHDRLWALFCIHDDIQPYLEFYTDPKSSSLHQPLWAATLSHCLHVSPSIVSSSSSSTHGGIDGGSFDFVIVSSTSSSAGSLRLGAGTREQMNEWVDVLRNRLRDIGVIEPKENLYSPMPEGAKAATGNGILQQHSSRDPNSPLPLPPLPQVTTATQSVPASNTHAAADLLQRQLLIDDEPLMEHVTVIAVTNDTNQQNQGQQEGLDNAAAAVVTVQTMQQQNQNSVGSMDRLSPRVTTTTNSVRNQQQGVTRVRIASAPSSMQEALGLDHPLNALALSETGIDYNDDDDDDDDNQEENGYETIFSTSGGGVVPCSPTRPTPPPTATIPTLPPPPPPVLVPSARQGQSSSLTIVEHPPVIRTASASRPPSGHFQHHLSSQQQQQRSREGLRRTVSVGPAEQYQQPRSMPILLSPASATAAAAAAAAASRRRGEGLVLFQPPAPPLSANSPLFRGPPVGLIAPLIASSPPASTNHGAAATAAASSGDGGNGYSLKERQVQRLRMEIQHPAGVRIVLKKKDCLNTIALIDALGTVWVGGWRQKEKPLLYNVFHIGDQIVRVGHCNVTSSSDIQRLLKADGQSTQIEFIVRRVPFGRVFHLRREADGQPVGIITDLSSEVREVVAGGLAAQQGVPALAISPMTMEPCTWTLTEINGRPLNVCSREGEARDRLAAVGRAVTILLQPTDFVNKVIKKGLKGLRGYKDFLLG